MSHEVGVDVGGTFTDFVIVRPGGRDLAVHKELTTPADPSVAIEKGLAHLFSRLGLEGAEVRVLVHGTTLVSNSIIERKGAKVLLITTRGVRDVLDTGTENRYDINDRLLTRPTPLVPRRSIVEVEERLLADGRVFLPLRLDGLVEQLKNVGPDEVEALAVCLIHAYRHPDHEEAVLELLNELFPGVPVSISSQVAPEIREYPRTSTTVANAYVQPLVQAYLRRLRSKLDNLGITCQLFVMQSDGGIVSDAVAAQFPVRLVESGAAGGAQAGVSYSVVMGAERLISFDMGGTTAKICVIDDHQPVRAASLEVARVHRFRKGSGLPLLVPVIELLEIGAGGGSIARVDELGLLKVGPTSAGADPGPACYGLGGEAPTVTDAALVLGYLNPDYFLGGRLKLDRKAAEDAIGQAVAAPLGLDVVAAAAGIFEVATQNMASAARVYLAELGRDARAYSLVGFGGAGPVHACRIGAALKVARVIIPPAAGTTSALGFLTAPIAFDHGRTLLSSLSELDLNDLASTLDVMIESGLAAIAQAGVAADEATSHRWADMRYQVQTHEIEVALPERVEHVDQLRDLFEARYRELYGRTLQNREIEMVRCRVRTEGRTPEPVSYVGIGGGGERETPRRNAFFAGQFTECEVASRRSLVKGVRILGPAIVEEENTTIVVEPGWCAEVDEWQNLVLSPVGAS